MSTRLELAAIVKAYGSRRVLDRAWLNVGAGEAVGLIGANGAGKTTLLRIAAGLICPDEGLIRVLQKDGRPLVRYFGGERTMPPGVIGKKWAHWFGVETMERRPLGQLSRGSRQLFGLRTILSCAVADVILLDEPWEGLDPKGAAWLTACLGAWQRRGAAVLISSHRLHDLAVACSRFVVLEAGRCRRLDEAAGADQLEQVFQRR